MRDSRRWTELLFPYLTQKVLLSSDCDKLCAQLSHCCCCSSHSLGTFWGPQGPQFSLIQPQKILDSPSGGISIGAGSVLREKAVASPGTESNSGPSSVCARISAESKTCHSFLWGLLVLCAGSQKWKTSVFLLWPVRNLGLIMDISLLSSLLLSSAPWWWAKGCREKLWVTFRFSLDREEMTVEVGRKSSHPESWGRNLHISKGLFMEDYAFSSMTKAKSGLSAQVALAVETWKSCTCYFSLNPTSQVFPCPNCISSAVPKLKHFL